MSVTLYLIQSVFVPHFWIIFTITSVLSYYWMTKRKYNLPPMPHALPIVGNMFSIPSNESPYLVSKRWAEELNEPVIRMRLGSSDAVYLCDLKTAQEAMIEHGDDFHGRPCSAMLEYASNGYQDVSLSDISPRWKVKHRLLLQALKTFGAGEAFEERVHSCFNQIAELMDQKAKLGEAVNPFNWADLLIYNFMAALLYQKVFDLDDEKFISMRDGFLKGSASLAKTASVDNYPILKYLPFKMPDLKESEDAITPLLVFNEQAIVDHKENFDVENVRDLTDHILKANYEAEGKKGRIILTDAELKLIVVDVFGASIITQTTMMTWFYHQMAMYPSVQEKVYQELKEVLGQDKVTAKDRFRLPYTEAVQQECIRFGTITGLGIAHKTMVDTQVGGYDIPKGTTVLVNYSAIHFNPEQFEDPWVFKPERFLHEGRVREPNGFIHFGIGRRACPAKELARSNLFMMLTQLVRRYKISPAPGETLKIEFDQDLGKPKPFKIVVKRRE